MPAHPQAGPIHCGAMSTPEGPEPARPKPHQPHLLVIMTDQQKATASELYGGPVRTPHLARIASQGVLYERAYTPHPLCVPARVSLWTGRWPHAHGARTNETPMPRARRTSPASCTGRATA